MNYSEYLKSMLDAALDIKVGNFDKKYGICINLSDKVNRQVEESEESEERYDSWEILKQAFYTWPKFSGDEAYPINDPKGIETPHNVYPKLPKWVGEYGELRFELLDHIINFIEKEIEHAEAVERNT